MDAVISLKECFILPVQGCSTNLTSILYSHLPLYFLLYSCPLECHLFFSCNQYSNDFSSSIFSMKDSQCVLCPSSSWLLLSVLYFGRYYNILFYVLLVYGILLIAYLFDIYRFILQKLFWSNHYIPALGEQKVNKAWPLSSSSL